MARYLPIAEHGLIGDLHTVALVGTDGTIVRVMATARRVLKNYRRRSEALRSLGADRGSNNVPSGTYRLVA